MRITPFYLNFSMPVVDYKKLALIQKYPRVTRFLCKATRHKFNICGGCFVAGIAKAFERSITLECNCPGCRAKRGAKITERMKLHIKNSNTVSELLGRK